MSRVSLFFPFFHSKNEISVLFNRDICFIQCKLFSVRFVSYDLVNGNI